jgi:hypothetical protein
MTASVAANGSAPAPPPEKKSNYTPPDNPPTASSVMTAGRPTEAGARRRETVERPARLIAPRASRSLLSIPRAARRPSLPPNCTPSKSPAQAKDAEGKRPLLARPYRPSGGAPVVGPKVARADTG